MRVRHDGKGRRQLAMDEDSNGSPRAFSHEIDRYISIKYVRHKLPNGEMIVVLDFSPADHGGNGKHCELGKLGANCNEH